MTATNTADFTFSPQDGGTLVTWSMSGRKNFLSKAMFMCMSMDKMLGPDFERGLAQLKSTAESAATATAKSH